MREKYTKEILQEAVNNSISYAGVLKFLNLKLAGGTQSHLKKRIQYFDIDTSHFTGQSWLKGGHSTNKIPKEDILTLKEDGVYRTKSYLLRRALTELGVEYKCSKCGITKWNGKYITLHVDHINGNKYDDRKDNLRFLCPNCHTQTPTYGSKN